MSAYVFQCFSIKKKKIYSRGNYFFFRKVKTNNLTSIFQQMVFIKQDFLYYLLLSTYGIQFYIYDYGIGLL